MVKKYTIKKQKGGDPKLIRTDTDIKTAVDDWCFHKPSAIEMYGDISEWDTNAVTNMDALFHGKKSFNDDISKWDVSNVTTMWSMFANADAFNINIGDWDVSNVISMRSMFSNAKTFNQPIGRWNTVSVTNMHSMFSNAEAFNENIGDWDVSNVTIMHIMFWEANAFNKPIGNWDVSEVTSMFGMFQGATSFNQPIGNWKTGKVTSMFRMFYDAKNFNQDINNWEKNINDVLDSDPSNGYNNVSNDENLKDHLNIYMFHGSAMTYRNYPFGIGAHVIKEITRFNKTQMKVLANVAERQVCDRDCYSTLMADALRIVEENTPHVKHGGKTKRKKEKCKKTKKRRKIRVRR